MGVAGVIMCYGFKARIRIMGIRRWTVELETRFEVARKSSGKLRRDHGIEKTLTGKDVATSKLLVFTKAQSHTTGQGVYEKQQGHGKMETFMIPHVVAVLS
jgi:hypothetical protein